MKPPKVTFSDMWHRFAEAKEDRSPVSSQYDKARSCLSKKAHVTKEMAEKAAATETRIEGVPYVHYKCRWCPYFHIGHQRHEKEKRV
jgi:hypothetical protein